MATPPVSDHADPLELLDSEEVNLPRGGDLRGRAITHLDRLDITIKVFAVVTLVCFVATIVMIGLAQAEYIHPLIALYTFSGCIGSLIVIKAIDCAQQGVANKHHIDLQDYYNVRQPMPKKPKDPMAKKKE